MSVQTTFEAHDPWVFIQMIDGRITVFQCNADVSDRQRTYEVRVALRDAISGVLENHRDDRRADLIAEWRPVNADHALAMEFSNRLVERARGIVGDDSPGRSWFPDQADGRQGQTHISIWQDRVVEFDLPEEVLADHLEVGRVLMQVTNQALERLEADILAYAEARTGEPDYPDWAQLARQAKRALG